MGEIQELQKEYIKFRDERNWKQFHTPENLASALSLEAAEVSELFQWKTREQVEEYIKTNKQDISDEIADVFSCILGMCEVMDIDLAEALKSKLEKTKKKYPIEKFKNIAATKELKP